MKKLLILILLLLGYTVNVMAQGQDKTPISKASWLIGTWKGMYNGVPFYETWRKKDDNTLIGYSITISEGDTLAKENNVIRVKGNALVFTDPNVYESKRIMDNEVTFEREDSKAFSRLVWINTKDDHWWAVLQHAGATTTYDLVREPMLDKVVDTFIRKIQTKKTK